MRRKKRTLTIVSLLLVTFSLMLGNSVSGGQPEYEAAARLAHDRCFIGRALAPEVNYEVGSVQVREAAPLAIASDEARAHGEHADREVVGPRSPDARTARAST